MSDKNSILYKILIALPIVCLLISYIVVLTKSEKQRILIDELNSKIEYYSKLDSSYVARKDSIAYNIDYRDSVIYNIRYEYETQKEIIASMPDDVIVDKFKELVWAE